VKWHLVVFVAEMMASLKTVSIKRGLAKVRPDFQSILKAENCMATNMRLETQIKGPALKKITIASTFIIIFSGPVMAQDSNNQALNVCAIANIYMINAMGLLLDLSMLQCLMPR
jgi:hypothetical protein